MLSHKDIIARFQTAEAGPELTRLFQDPEFCEIYPLLRQKVVGENVAPMATASAGFGGRGRLAALMQILRHEANPANWRRQRPVDLLMFSYTTSRLFALPQGWPDAYAEPFLSAAQDMGLSGDIIEVPAAGEYRMPRIRPGHLVGLDELRARVMARLRPVPPHMSAAVEACRCALSEQGLQSDTIRPEAWRRLWSYFTHRRALFARQLRRFHPKLLISITWYGTTCMAMNSAAQSMGIPAADMQHGVQGHDHCIYGPWAAPATHSTMMPRGWLNWSAWDKANLERWIGAHQRAYDCGIPWHQLDPALLAANADFRKVQQAAAGRPIVLVSLQPNSAALLDHLEAVLRDPAAAGYAWALRCHPGSVNQVDQIDARFAGHDNVLPIAPSTFVPLSMILSASTAHLTEYSSVVLEAAAGNLPSVLISDFGLGFYSHLGEDLLTVEPDPARLVGVIAQLRARNEGHRTQSADDATVPVALGAIWRDVTAGNLSTRTPALTQGSGPSGRPAPQQEK